MPFKRQVENGNLEIALVDYWKNTFKISVLFDTSSDILDKGLLLNCSSFVRQIGKKLIGFFSPEIIKNLNYFRGNWGRLISSNSLNGGGEIWRRSQRFLIIFTYKYFTKFTLFCRIFYWIVFIFYSWPKLGCIIPSNGLDYV